MLEYWIQFLISRNCLHLLQFWFSVASFKNASSSSNKFPSRTPATENSDIRKVECLSGESTGSLAGHVSGKPDRMTSDSSCMDSVNEGIHNSHPKGEMEPQSFVEFQSQEVSTTTLNGVGREVGMDGGVTEGTRSSMISQRAEGGIVRQTSLSKSTCLSIYTTTIKVAYTTPMSTYSHNTCKCACTPVLIHLT